MSGFTDSSFNQQITIGIFNHVVEKVFECINLMNQDCEHKSIKLANNETTIRDYLYNNYLNKDAVLQNIEFDNYRFFSEVPENYISNKPLGRADLLVISEDNFRFREKYFIIECKRIDGNLTLNREYIDEGIRRFVGKTPKYSSYYKMNCMLGFIIKKININNNVSNINQLLQSDYSDINVQVYLHAGLLPNTFMSSHGESEDEQRTLIHAFCDCVSVIESANKLI